MHEPNSPASSDDSVLIRLEVLQASTSSADPKFVSKHVEQLLRSRRLKYSNECIPFAAEDDDFLSKHVVSISIVDTETDQEAPQGTHLLFWQACLSTHHTGQGMQLMCARCLSLQHRVTHALGLIRSRCCRCNLRSMCFS